MSKRYGYQVKVRGVLGEGRRGRKIGQRDSAERQPARGLRESESRFRSTLCIVPRQGTRLGWEEGEERRAEADDSSAASIVVWRRHGQYSQRAEEGHRTPISPMSRCLRGGQRGGGNKGKKHTREKKRPLPIG